MANKWLIVSVAGLGWEYLEKRKINRLAGLELSPADSIFPAVTCTAQASFRTATYPKEHGMIANGLFDRRLGKAMFWEQSANLVEGPRIWDAARENGAKIGIMFWQQSMGENADCIITPAPIHKHNGGMVMDNYIVPSDAGARIRKKCGKFPLGRYWGPLASPKVGNAVIKYFETALEEFPLETVFLYLPTLDYDFQRYGPDDERSVRSLDILTLQLERLVSLAEKKGYNILFSGDYAINEVTSEPVYPNITLREASLFNTRSIKSMAYPDLFSSRAFALADHEISHVYIRNSSDIQLVWDLFTSTGDYETVEVKTANTTWGHDSAGEILLTARKGSWCAYQWWTKNSEAPDYASHVDIHSKPGFDPCELFFDSCFSIKTCQDPSRIGGTHGRQSKVAFASSVPLAGLSSEPTFISLASAIKEALI
jgi:predicted AlkP superfamily pyrophosphatase or phosphodiesterase